MEGKTTKQKLHGLMSSGAGNTAKERTNWKNVPKSF